MLFIGFFFLRFLYTLVFYIPVPLSNLSFSSTLSFFLCSLCSLSSSSMRSFLICSFLFLFCVLFLHAICIPVSPFWSSFLCSFFGFMQFFQYVFSPLVLCTLFLYAPFLLTPPSYTLLYYNLPVVLFC